MELDGDFAGLGHIGEVFHAVAPDRPRGSSEHHLQGVALVLVLGQRQDGGDALVLSQRQDVDDILALGLGRREWQFPHLQLVNPAQCREKQHWRVGGGDKDLGEEILFLG